MHNRNLLGKLLLLSTVLDSSKSYRGLNVDQEWRVIEDIVLEHIDSTG